MGEGLHFSIFFIIVFNDGLSNKTILRLIDLFCLLQAFVIAYTSDWIPRMVYRVGYSIDNRPSLEGYIVHSLSGKQNYRYFHL